MSSPPPLESPGIGLWNSKFRDPGLEDKFRLATVREWKRRLSLVAISGGAFYLAGFWVDYSIMGINPTSIMLLIVRVVFAALAVGLGLYIRRIDDHKTIDYLSLLVLMACVVGTLLIIHQSKVPATRHALTIFVFVMIFFIFVPTRIWINTVSSFSLSLGFLIITLFTTQTPVAVLAMIIIYVVLGNILGWFTAIHLQRLNRLQWFNLRAEREAQAQLLKEVDERKQAEESLRQLASGVAHNFNNSLMAITSNLQAAQGVLRQGGKLSAAQGFLTNAWQSAASGREVAQRLTRAVVGEKASSRGGELVDIGELIHHAQNIARLTWSRSGHTHEFSAQIAPDLWVMANRGELIEVFLNLFKNSLEAMDTGGCLQVWAERRDERIVVEVQDDGRGIELDIQKRLFKPFVSDKGVSGQGLGLAVSRGILQGLGGSIACQSQPGQGTTMIIELPAAAERPTLFPEPAPAEAHPQALGRRVLLVEDEGLIALGVSAILRQEGYRVWQAQDLAEAEVRLSEARPELVVCDYGLPDGNATNVHQMARRWARESDSPEPAFIVLTGWSEAQLNGDPALFSFKPFAWLQKPVNKKELLDVLRDALARKDDADLPAPDGAEK
ncbi:MAG: ATP-binding protein [Desulfarculaceae bacterium]|jgi:signal transduction histidine kinase/ActR/RegA family two-component response regulator